MILNDAYAEANPRPVPLPHLFGGKKWVKDLFLGRFIHSDPCIGDGYFYIIAQFDLIRLYVMLIKGHVLCLNIEITAGWHCLPGIHIEVQQNLLHLSPVNLRSPKVFFVGSMNGDFFLGSAEHAILIFDKSV